MKKKEFIGKRCFTSISFIAACLLMITMNGCGIVKINGSDIGSIAKSKTKVPNPNRCTDNTELELRFIDAISSQNRKILEACYEEGVNINGATCSCVVKTSVVLNSGAWGSVRICDSKPFFLEAIATGNSSVIKWFIEKGVEINQGYAIHEYEKTNFGYIRSIGKIPQIKSSIILTTLDVFLSSPYDPDILDLLLTKGVKVTETAKRVAKNVNDEELIKIFKKHNIEL